MLGKAPTADKYKPPKVIAHAVRSPIGSGPSTATNVAADIAIDDIFVLPFEV